MNITVKLYANFRQYLPSGRGSQGVQIETTETTTPMQLLMQFKVPSDEIHLLLLNGVYVEPKFRNQPILKNNDVLAAWPAVAGG